MLAVLLVCLLGAFLCWIQRRFATKLESALPPGPAGLPVFGLTFHVTNPGRKVWTLFEEWEKQFNCKGLLTVKTLRRINIVISSPAIATELLDKRSATFANRPRDVYFGELCFADLNLTSCAGGERVSSLRKLYFEQLNSTAVRAPRPVQERLALDMIRSLASSGDGLSHIQRHLKLMTIEMFCGKLTPQNLEYIDTHEAVMRTRRTPAIAPLLDLFPFALWLLPYWTPGCDFKRRAAIYYRDNLQFWSSLQADVRAQMEQEVYQSSFFSRLIKSDAFSRHGFSQKDASMIIGTQLGSNFGSNAIVQICLIALLHYPHVQEQLHAEMDEVIDRERVPCFDDLNGLVYLKAFILEVLRWRSIVPIVQPHVALEDQKVADYLIPKGAVIWVNTVAMSRNEDLYPNAAAFKPERFLSSSGRAVTRKFEHPTFGYGKRRCPAAHLAESTVSITLAMLIWAFTVKRYRDDELPDIDIERWSVEFGFLVPPAFRVHFEERGMHVLKALERSHKEGMT